MLFYITGSVALPISAPHCRNTEVFALRGYGILNVFIAFLLLMHFSLFSLFDCMLFCWQKILSRPVERERGMGPAKFGGPTIAPIAQKYKVHQNVPFEKKNLNRIS